MNSEKKYKNMQKYNKVPELGNITKNQRLSFEKKNKKRHMEKKTSQER